MDIGFRELISNFSGIPRPESGQILDDFIFQFPIVLVYLQLFKNISTYI